MMSSGRRMIAVFALVAGGALPAQGAVITACGPNVCYEYDNTQLAIALTGSPTLVGDSMVFLAPSFAALSTGGSGWVTTGGATGNFIFSRVYTTNALNEITSLSVHEEFDYEIITDGEVRAALYTQARSLLVATDGTSATADFQSSGDSGGTQVDTLDVLLNPAAAFTGLANDMTVGIQNTLRAYTSASPSGQYAFIQKKFTLVTETLTPVPLPGAVWLFGGGLALLGWLRSRAS